ncbi:MAG: hypothetical protein ABMA64_17235 [Myxococcota bacterium]
MRFVVAAALLAGCQEYDLLEQPEGEVYVQVDDDAKADVLFVVDDSASMAEEQQRLASNFAAFVDAVQGTEADWHLGVVTTDLAQAGWLRGGVIDPETADLDAVAAAALVVGTTGDRVEQGFSAAELALDGRNAGFLRPDARLNVVFFSDEDDQSASTVDGFLAALADRAGDEGAAVHGVVGDLPDGCASGTSAAAAGGRYLAAIEQTSGWRESICADDYVELLTRVGFEAAGLQDTFPLARVPKTDTLSVRVDDVVIPEREVDGWTYEPGDNVVVFHGRAIPRAGMTIGFDYVPLLGVEN